MQIHIWTLASDTDRGTECAVFLTEREADLARIDAVFPNADSDEQDKADKATALELYENDDDEFAEFMDHNTAMMDTYSIDCAVLEIPDPKPQFTGDELATILHGLSIIQDIRRRILKPERGGNDCMAFENQLTRLDGELEKVDDYFSCDHFAPDWKPLTDAQIDALCERINPLDAEPLETA